MIAPNDNQPADNVQLPSRGAWLLLAVDRIDVDEQNERQPLAVLIEQAEAGDDNPMAQLRASIQAEGQRLPAIVYWKPDGRAGLWDGHRRLAAIIAAGRSEVEVVVVPAPASDHERDKGRLLSNLLREDSDPIGVAWTMQRMMERDGLTQKGVAEIIKRSQGWVGGHVLMLGMPQEVQALVSGGSISWNHAAALRRIKAQEIDREGSPLRTAVEVQTEYASIASLEGLSVPKLEERVESYLSAQAQWARDLLAKQQVAAPQQTTSVTSSQTGPAQPVASPAPFTAVNAVPAPTIEEPPQTEPADQRNVFPVPKTGVRQLELVPSEPASAGAPSPTALRLPEPTAATLDESQARAWMTKHASEYESSEDLATHAIWDALGEYAEVSDEQYAEVWSWAKSTIDTLLPDVNAGSPQAVAAPPMNATPKRAPKRVAEPEPELTLRPAKAKTWEEIIIEFNIRLLEDDGHEDGRPVEVTGNAERFLVMDEGRETQSGDVLDRVWEQLRERF